jgi:integrase
MKLTQANVAKLRLPAGKSDAIFFDDDMPGFGLRLRAGGRRTWIIQYRVGSQTRRLTLGTVEKLSAAKARDEAKNRLARVALGGDPQQEKHDARAEAGQTVGKLVENYLARRHYELGKEPLRQSSYEATALYLNKHCKPLHTKLAGKVDRSDIAKRLDEIEAKVSSVTASRVRVALSTMFAWAVGQGIVTNNPVIGTNKPPEPEARDRVLSEAELRDVWAALQRDGYGDIVRLLMHTGQRRDEIGALRWSEIDFDRETITIPAARTKNKREHVVPLSDAARDILEARHRIVGRDLVFGEGQGGFSGWSKSKERLDARLLEARRKALGKEAQPMPDWRLHDIRRSVATHMAEIGIQPHIIEAVLNHVSGHKAGVAGVYNRATYLTEKTAALTRWADHLLAVVMGNASNVVPLRAATA